MRIAAALILVFFAILSGPACSVPVLEPEVCTDARRSLREFYSFHFGREMPFSPEGLEERRLFLSREFAESVKEAEESTDPFTTGKRDIPRAFRIGRCVSDTPDRARFDVLIFWRDEVRSEQQKITVELKLEEDRWLVDGIDQ
jgi:hypothetical protein